MNKEFFGPVEIRRTSRGKITKSTMRDIVALNVLTVYEDGKALHDSETKQTKKCIVDNHTKFEMINGRLVGKLWGVTVTIMPKDDRKSKSLRARELFLEQIDAEKRFGYDGNSWEEGYAVDSHNEALDNIKRLFEELFPLKN